MLCARDFSHPHDTFVLVATGLSRIEQQAPAIRGIELHGVLFGTLRIRGQSLGLRPLRIAQRGAPDGDVCLAIQRASKPEAVQIALCAGEKRRVILHAL